MVFTNEQKTFMIETYFRNGHQVNGEWVYEIQPCFREFREQFPEFAVDELNFTKTLKYVVTLFRETGSIQRKSGSGRPKKRTLDTIENIDLSYGTCHKIVKKI
ncbi:hypothetical protein ABEB36_009218 [Hypothenemus hampei]|uniref:DUF4817 domain-containing protein n=1 Tax=Hypothenemus hampei TaxID=57062 RepID=A0ABD1ETH6_HYPHA